MSAGPATAGWAAPMAPQHKARQEWEARAELLQCSSSAKGIHSPAASCGAAPVHKPTQPAAISDTVPSSAATQHSTTEHLCALTGTASALSSHTNSEGDAAAQSPALSPAAGSKSSLPAPVPPPPHS